MVVKVERKNGSVIAMLNGEIDHHSAKALRESIDNELNKGDVRELVLDFSGVGFMDSSGLGLILGRYTKAQEIGCLLILQNPTRRIRRIMEVSGIGGMIKTEETKSEVNENGKKTGK